MMLEQFGLNNYENKVYLALLSMGLADARSISKESDVPYGRIYDVLDTLHSKKIITEIKGRPKKYAVVEPELTMEILMKNKEEELKQLKKQADVTIQELKKQYEGKPVDELVWKVAIGEELFPAYFDLLIEAKREFLGYMELNISVLEELEYLDEYRRVMNTLQRKGVDIKIIFSIEDLSILDIISEQAPEMLDILKFAEIRYTSSNHLGFSIIDGEKVILKVVNPMNKDEFLAGIYLWQQSLADTMYQSFTEMWEEAEPLRLKLEL